MWSLRPDSSRSGIDADDRVPVGQLLKGVSGPHDEWVVEEASDELHANRETSRRLTHRKGECWMASVVERLSIAGATRARRRKVVLDGLKVAVWRVVLGRRHNTRGHHEYVDVGKCVVVCLDIGGTHILGLGVHSAVVVASA